MPQPRITNSADALDTLHPRIGFMAGPHDAVQVRVESAAGTWDSGPVETADYSLVCAQIAPGLDCSARARVRAEGGWSEWSGAWRFQTPPEPVLRIIRPAHASSVIGPDIEVRGEIESASPLAGVRVSLDERALDLSPRQDGLYCGRVSLEGGMHYLRVEAEAGGQSASVLPSSGLELTPEAGEIVVLDLSEAGTWPVSEDPVAALRIYDLMMRRPPAGAGEPLGPRLLLRCYDQDDEWRLVVASGRGWRKRPSAASRGRASRRRRSSRRSRVPGRRSRLVVWDRQCRPTSNVATTAAGVEDLLPLRAGSALAGGFQSLGLKVSLDLTGKFTGTGRIPDTALASTGSAKCDACLWAKARYLDTGRANARVLGYWLDAYWLQRPGRMHWWEHCLTNHDWIVRNRGFVFDLSNWGDKPRRTTLTDAEPTSIRSKQSSCPHTSRRAAKSIFHSRHGSNTRTMPIARAHGSSPPNGRWCGCPAHNCYLDADAHGLSAMANASLWTCAGSRFAQTPPPRASLQARGFLDSEGRLRRWRSRSSHR